MTTPAEKEAEKAKRLLARADQYLAAVEDAFIIKERGHVVRPMPRFRAEEISLGKVLGTGGFGIVNEISKFTLDPDPPEQHSSSVGSDVEGQANGVANGPHPEESSKDPPKAEHAHDMHQDHDEMIRARHVMEKQAVKKGVCRYAIKRLHDDLTELERARGMVDLALEAKYLSVVWHPNIIKVRGMGDGHIVNRDFFIILDRLFGTLDTKINEWNKAVKTASGTFLGIGKKKMVLQRLLLERMTVAYDLAAAFFYLHENRLVYRDIKPENIGFDIRGDVKVFDFGLCKSLSNNLRARDGKYGYRLTGRAGSLPYMAPEVVKMETYDTKCDVFSFAILLWEFVRYSGFSLAKLWLSQILSLKQAFKGMSPDEFVEKVVLPPHERPPISKNIPPLTRLMIPEAWDDDPRKRPDMKRVAILIRGDLNDMSSDANIRQRTKHMDDRSNHSLAGKSFDSDDMQ